MEPMKNLILAILLIPSLAIGASLTCDPQEGVTKYRVTGEVVDAETDGSVKWNISGISAGEYNGTLEAGREYVLDGVPQGVWRWSDPVPFVLGVPEKSSPSTGQKIVQ
jgi:hypothetical protein